MTRLGERHVGRHSCTSWKANDCRINSPAEAFDDLEEECMKAALLRVGRTWGGPTRGPTTIGDEDHQEPLRELKRPRRDTFGLPRDGVRDPGFGSLEQGQDADASCVRDAAAERNAIE